MKFYLAGKIAPSDWRHAIVPKLAQLSEEDARASASRSLVLDGAEGGHVYTGPFFWDVGNSSHGAGDPSNHSFLYDDDCRGVVAACFHGIDRADLVFAWLDIDAATAHGTLVEIGYAIAKGKRVVVASTPDADLGELWFARWAAAEHIEAPDALSAFRRALELDVLASCESPIEVQLGEAMVRARCAGRLAAKFVAQHNVSAGGTQYRLDFAFVEERVAIECDGHDFHERTKEQARHDRQRDRALVAEGWRVLRFTGSEIHRSPDGCAAEVIAIVSQSIHERPGDRDVRLADALLAKLRS